MIPGGLREAVVLQKRLNALPLLLDGAQGIIEAIYRIEKYHAGFSLIHKAQNGLVDPVDALKIGFPPLTGENRVFVVYVSLQNDAAFDPQEGPAAPAAILESKFLSYSHLIQYSGYDGLVVMNKGLDHAPFFHVLLVQGPPFPGKKMDGLVR